MLGDAARLARHDVGLAQCVQKRRLAVIDVAHDRHHRRTWDQRCFVVGLAPEPDLDVGSRDALGAMPELAHHQFGGIRVKRLIDGRHDVHLHEHLDDIDAALRHAVGQLLYGDRVRDDDVTVNLPLAGGVRGGLALFPFPGAAHRRKASHALAIAQCLADGELAFAAALARAANRGPAPIWTQAQAARPASSLAGGLFRRLGCLWRIAKTLGRLLGRLALRLFLILFTFGFLGLANVGRVALCGKPGLIQRQAFGFDLGPFARLFRG